MLVVGLTSNSELIGTLALSSRRIGAFGLREQSILERLANQIAPAIEGAKLYCQLVANAAEMAVVDEVAKIITTTLDIHHVYEKFAGEVKKLVDFDMATINLVDTNADVVEIAYFYGEDVQNFREGQKISFGETQSGWVIANHKTYIVDDMAENLEFEVHRSLVADGLRSLVTLPLITNGNAIGTITLASNRTNAFGQKEKLILEKLATLIAPALENARFYHESMQLGLALDSIGDAVMFDGAEGVVQFANRAFRDVFGYSEDESLGMNAFAVMPPDNASQAHSYERLKVAREGPWQGEVRCIRKNGEEFDV